MDQKQAIRLLKKYSTDEKHFKIILAHSKKVQEIALRIAKKIPKADINFIKTASLLHDIGRFKFPPGKVTIKHGLEGANILRKEKLPRHARAAERHMGAGMTKKEIIRQNLDLPKKDFIPKTIEEKIICHADNLTFGKKEGTLKQVIQKFRPYGKEIVERIRQLDKELTNQN